MWQYIQVNALLNGVTVDLWQFCLFTILHTNMEMMKAETPSFVKVMGRGVSY